MAAVCHLGFVMTFGPPTKVFGGIDYCTQFRWNQCSSFGNMQVLIFNEFLWKMPIHASKMQIFGL